RFVNLLETAGRPPESLICRAAGGDMKFHLEHFARTPFVKTLAAAGLAASLLASPALAQQSGNGLSSLFGGIFSSQKSDAPPPQAAVPGATGPIPWSGEDGASGHPLMTANAIREAAANFSGCVAGMWPDAARRNIARENFDRFTAGLTP